MNFLLSVGKLFVKYISIPIISISILSFSKCSTECPVPKGVECIAEPLNYTVFCISEEFPEGKVFPIDKIDGWSCISQSYRTQLIQDRENLCRQLNNCEY